MSRSAKLVRPYARGSSPASSWFRANISETIGR